MTLKSDEAAAPLGDARVTPRQWRVGLGLILLLALVFRVYGVIRYPAALETDSIEYHHLATQIAQGNGYVGYTGITTGTRTPGYPGFLAAVYFFSGPDVSAAYWVQAVVGTLSVGLLMSLGALLLGRREALLVGALAAVYPSFFWLPRRALSENIGLVFLLAALCAGAMWMRTRRPLWIILAGLCLGGGTLVRGSTILVVAVLCIGLVLWLRRSEPSRQSSGFSRYAPLMWLLMSAFVVVAPWCLRNYGAFGRFALATEEGVAWYYSYWPPVREGKRIWGDVDMQNDPFVAALVKREGTQEARFSDSLRRETFSRLARQPSYFFRLIPTKLTYLMVPFDWEVLPRAPGRQRSVNWLYLLLIAPAAWGAWLLWRRRTHSLLWLLWVVPIAVLLQSILFYGSPRFRLPAETSLLLCAAVGLLHLWDAASRRRASSPPIVEPTLTA